MYDKRYMDKHYIQSFCYENEYSALPLVRCEGHTLIMEENKRLIDLTGQLGAVVCGNSNKAINEPVKQLIDNVGFAWEESCIKEKELFLRFFFENIFSKDEKFEKIKLFVTGSEAIEAAISLAEKVSDGNTILTHRFAYHGWTTDAHNCSDFPEFGTFVDANGCFEGKNKINTAFYEYPICSECAFGKKYEVCKRGDELYCIKELRREIIEIGARNIIAVFSDCILGLAAIIPPPEFIPQFQKIVKEYDLTWIDDEIFSAFRFGNWFAYQQYKSVCPDIVCFGKSFSNGITPLSGIAISDELAKKIKNFKWQICSSYAGNPISIVSAYYNLKYINDNNILLKVNHKGRIFEECLYRIKKKSSLIERVDGKGMFWSVKIKDIFNYQNRRYIPPKGVKTTLGVLRKICIKNGLLIGGYVNSIIRISPSITMSDQEIRWACSLLEKSLIELERYCNAEE